MKTKNDLPAVSSLDIEKALKNEGVETIELLKAQGFTRMLNKPVEKDKLVTHHIAKDMKYLPISFMEMALDELFFGQWSTTDFHYTLITNEVVGDITLIVEHPTTKREIRRIGADAVQIMVDSPPIEMKYKDGDSRQVSASKKQKEISGH